MIHLALQVAAFIFLAVVGLAMVVGIVGILLVLIKWLILLFRE